MVLGTGTRIYLVLKIIEKVGSLTLMRIRVGPPKMMRIHMVKLFVLFQ
jgi:hypothetical protein